MNTQMQILQIGYQSEKLLAAVFIYAAPGVLHKRVGQVGYADAEAVGQLVQLHGLGEMLVDIQENLLHGVVQQLYGSLSLRQGAGKSAPDSPVLKWTICQ